MNLWNHTYFSKIDLRKKKAIVNKPTFQNSKFCTFSTSIREYLVGERYHLIKEITFRIYLKI